MTISTGHWHWQACSPYQRRWKHWGSLHQLIISVVISVVISAVIVTLDEETVISAGIMMLWEDPTSRSAHHTDPSWAVGSVGAEEYSRNVSQSRATSGKQSSTSAMRQSNSWASSCRSFVWQEPRDSCRLNRRSRRRVLLSHGAHKRELENRFQLEKKSEHCHPCGYPTDIHPIHKSQVNCHSRFIECAAIYRWVSAIDMQLIQVTKWSQ